MDDITKKIEGEKEELTELESKMSEKQTKKEKLSSLVKKFNRRTVVIMTSVALIGGAIYLNWLFFSGESDMAASNNGYTIDYTNNGGEASFASSDKNGSEYFASVELSRSQARDEAVQVLAQVVENEGALEEVRADAAEGIGRIAELIEWCALIIGFVKGIWWPFIVGFPIVIALTVWIVCFYYRNVHYICPKCHTVFKPKFADFMFSNHTLTTRRLTCTSCGHRGFCVETAATEVKDDESAK